METEDRIVTLIDEEGEAFDFMIVDCFVVDEQEYAVMVPLSDEGEEDEISVCLDEFAGAIDDAYLDNSEETDGDDMEEEEAVIFRLYRNDDGETSFQLIEDEEEWQKVSSIAFERLYQAEE